ncbi:MAG: hypothetical protein EG825_15450 [Rhodocyclaceae bacterium]|nr:hypothetical protein [Rhodocyclaceae bacterium]
MDNQTRDKILKAITSEFDSFDATSFSEGLRLGDIPGWDSMSSINLQMALETEFAVELKDVSLVDSDTIATIVRLLGDHGVNV